MVEDYGTHLKPSHHRDHTVKLVKEKRNRVARKRSQGEAVTGRS